MRLRLFVFGLPLFELATGDDKPADPAPSGAEAYTERRPSEDTSWTHLGFQPPEDR